MLGLMVIMVAMLTLWPATDVPMARAQGAAGGEQPRYGGIVRMAEREPPNLDPPLSLSFPTHHAARLVYNGLRSDIHWSTG